MPPSLERVLDDLRILKDTTRSLSDACERNSSRLFDPVASDLKGFFDSVIDVSSAINHRDFRTRQDVDQVAENVDRIVAAAMEDLQDLQRMLSSSARGGRASSSRSPSPIDSMRLQGIETRIFRHTRSLRKKLAEIGGMEDWSRLSPKIPQPPSQRTSPKGSPKEKGKEKSALNFGAVGSFGSSTTSNERLSTPPSPYQATVEEVEDAGEDEEGHGVRMYHLSPPDVEAATTTSRRKVRQAVPSTPPQVIVRAPTDPALLEQQVKPVARNASPLRQSSGLSRNYKDSAVEDSIVAPHPDASTHSLTSTQYSKLSREELQAEIKRLETEIRERTPSNGSSSSRPHSQSPRNAYFGPNPSSESDRHSHSGRRRAATTTDTARPHVSPRDRLANVLDDHSRVPRRPRVSPRNSPLNPAMSPRPARAESPRWPWDSTDERHGRLRRQRRDSYGGDPRTSLPTGLENLGLGDAPSTVRETRRVSWAFDNPNSLLGNFMVGGQGVGVGVGDFELFGGSNNIPTNQAPPAQEQQQQQQQSRSPPARFDDIPPHVTQKKLPVSLEDLCNGARMMVRFHRHVPDPRSRVLFKEEKILEVPIYKGLKPGSRIKFRGEGDYIDGLGERGELWFLLLEKQHPVFYRRDLDLHATVELSVYDALCGWSRNLTSICGKSVRVSHPGPTPNGWRMCYAGLGMPKYDKDKVDEGGERGDLLVDVKIMWPARLEEWQKDLLKQVFGSGADRHGSGVGGGF